MTQSRRLELYRRHLDRELSAADARELEALLLADGVARQELESYQQMLDELGRASAPEPAIDFVAQVMRRLPASPHRSFFRDVLLAPRLSLAAALGLAALGVLTWLPLAHLTHRTRELPHQVAAAAQPAPPAGVVPSQIVVRFVLPARGARHVALAGDFNNWRTDDIILSDDKGEGVFSATVPLPPGHHSYLFFVDGQWVQDPAANSLPDGFGQRNSVLDL
jgi:hypothetical protein